MTDVREARAALERGRPVVLVTPPSPRRATMLWDLLPTGERTVLVTAGSDAALEWVAAAAPTVPIHAVTGLGRTSHLLQSEHFDVLAGSAASLAALVSRSALKLEGVATVVIAWPESLDTDQQTALDTLLAECSATRRIVLAWNLPALTDFLERHARRAEVVGSPSASQPPIGLARYAVVADPARPLYLHLVRDALSPARTSTWRAGDALPVERQDVIVCLDLPTRDELAEIAKAGEPVVLVTAAQLTYLRSIAPSLKAVTLAGPADRARDRAEELRTKVARLLEQRSVDAELAVLDPLFRQHDPAEVAAALLALGREPVAESREPTTEGQAWVKLFVNVGKKDRAQAKDLVGALTREVKVPRDAIGKIELRETFSLVDVAAEIAERVARDFTGVSVRGRRVQARVDRRS